MKANYRTFFGLAKEPFASDIAIREIMQTEALTGACERFAYAVRLGAIAVVTGEIGSGKSTALRYAIAGLHPSEYQCFYITGASGSILEVYRQLMAMMGSESASNSRAVMLGRIKKEIQRLVTDKKMKVVLVIDEASLMRLEVFAELHALLQFEKDAKPWLPVILAGQSSLIDKLMYPSSTPLASRVVARSHLEGMDREGMEAYISHHLHIAGADTSFYDPAAITAIHQGSGGLVRKANHLARCALIAAATEQSLTVTAEHVRLAATEIF
jgi:type II secretory pathway predicted ATPase ExeA